VVEIAGRALFQAFLPIRDRSRAYVWKYSQAVGGRRPPHFHAEPEINLVAAGSARFKIGDALIEVSAGELLAFPPGQDHALLQASADLYLYAIGMEPELSSEILCQDRDRAALPLRVRLEREDFAALARRAADIVDRAGVEQPAAELWDHAHWLRRKSKVDPKATMHVLTRRALQVVLDEPDIGLELLSHKLRAGPSEVSRYFHRDTGMRLVRYRARLRLLRFIRLVEDAAHNLMASASEAGFRSYSQCHRTFQAELGCAPREFFSRGVRERMQEAYCPPQSE
jgi:AraC-like DNA-binding protein